MTAREIVDGLLDPGSFVEHGGLAVAAQRSRRPLDELERETPADGLITGVGTLRGTPGQRVAVMVYDATVLAGTQGVMNHAKADRLLELAARQCLPLLLWAEGGGGRPGDVDWPGVAGLDCTTFARLAALSGQVPLVGLVGGRCFAGNAALLGCCDLIVATRHSSLGMAGPAMIEGGGLGKVAADDVGPAPKLAEAGVVDCLVDDDAAAVATGVALMRILCGAPQPPVPPSRSAESLREVVPAGRQAVFDVREVVAGLADAGSWVECREHFGRAVVTGVGRLEGQPVAWAASQPRHGAGALDAAACDKLARFLQLADARGWPVVTLVDTPGFMVGPASEAAGMIRHAARVFVAAAALRVPVVSVVLRRGFGLGAMALTGGHFHAPVATAAWPVAEFGAMGLEGAVRLGFRKELEAAPVAEREALFQRLLDDLRRRGDALNMASHLEIDTVIDPAHTRDWLVQVLSAYRRAPPRQRAASRFIDPW
jgi:acetyl-CoA carboxylase carboxyltransferase component